MKKFLCFFAIASVTLLSCNKDKVTPGEDSSEKPVVLEAVDLGLSVKWASFNVGAKAPEKYGDYFAWGETEPKREYTNYDWWTNYYWDTYKWCNGKAGLLTKYCPLNKSEYMDVGNTPDGKTVLEPEDDVAHVKLGGSWRMPTEDEWDELGENCTWTWNNTKKGYTVTGPNGNSIFLPAAGYWSGKNLCDAGSDGHYWSSSLRTGDPDHACQFLFDSAHGYIFSHNSPRCFGLSVRPVMDSD